MIQRSMLAAQELAVREGDFDPKPSSKPPAAVEPADAAPTYVEPTETAAAPGLNQADRSRTAPTITVAPIDEPDVGT